MASSVHFALSEALGQARDALAARDQDSMDRVQERLVDIVEELEVLFAGWRQHQPPEAEAEEVDSLFEDVGDEYLHICQLISEAMDSGQGSLLEAAAGQLAGAQRLAETAWSLGQEKFPG